MDTEKRFQGVLYAESAVTGPGGHGYFSNDDPGWFVWEDVVDNTADEILTRALRSPLVHTWHVVARGGPSRKWRYRGAYCRERLFTPAPIGPQETQIYCGKSVGLLLQRDTGADLLDLHCSLQEPLAILDGVPFEPPQLPLTRAKFAFTQMIYVYHGNFSPTERLPYPETINVMVFDKQEKQFTNPSFFLNLLTDEVRFH